MASFDDCDNTTDESTALDALTWYIDTDSDGFRNPNLDTLACTSPGYVSDNTDCDDGTASTYPNAPEYCNGVDDDCDNNTDENTALDALTWHQDLDSDGYGNVSNTLIACAQPNGYVLNSTDCDDTTGSTYPNAPEYCNGIDDDCNNNTDDNYAVDALTWYQDSDTDRFGNASASTQSCSQPSGYVTNSSDCNDSSGSVYPGATEFCNGIDDDCNNSVMTIHSTPTPITETLTAMDMARPLPLSPAHSPMDMSQTAQTAMMEAPASIQAPQSIATE